MPEPTEGYPSDPNQVPKRFPPLEMDSSIEAVIFRINQLSNWANIIDVCVSRLTDSLYKLVEKLRGG